LIENKTDVQTIERFLSKLQRKKRRKAEPQVEVGTCMAVITVLIEAIKEVGEGRENVRLRCV